MISTKPHVDLISTIFPEKIAIYLEYQGWKKVREVEGVASLWSKNGNNKTISVLLPLDNEFADFEIKIEELITVLARVEERPKTEILKVLGSVSALAQEKNRELLDIKIEFEDKNKHEVSAKKIGLVLKSLEDFFESIAQEKSKKNKSRNNKNIVKQELKLSLIDAFQGSFGLRVALPEYEYLNLLETFAQEAVEDFMNLIKASNLDNYEKLRQEIEKYKGEASVRFKFILKYFMELESDLVLEWGSVNPKKGEITKFPYDKIVQAFDVINKFELGNQKIIEVAGKLIMAGVGKKKDERIFVLNDEANKKDYKGHISPKLINTFYGNIELNKMYKATITEELNINSVTAKEAYIYTLVELKKITPNDR